MVDENRTGRAASGVITTNKKTLYQLNRFALERAVVNRQKVGIGYGVFFTKKNNFFLRRL